MKIGIDIDGVIVDTVSLMVREFPKYNGCKVTSDDVVHQFESIKDGVTFLNRYADYLFCSPPPISGAVEAINKLYENHDIYFITARYSQHYQRTLKWLKQYGVRADNLITCDATPKVKICKQFGIDTMIEDSARNALSIARAGIPVILLKYDYNLGVKHSKIMYCDDWFSILQTFDGNVTEQMRLQDMQLALFEQVIVQV